MTEERDFFVDVGYELPDNAPAQAEGVSTLYYQHPAGQYFGFVGKITPKYKDANGGRCESTDPGAFFSHYMLAFWLTHYSGTMEAPADKKIFSINESLPNGSIQELYFSVPLYDDPKKQWSYKNQFEDWKIPGHPQYNIIAPSPKNPGMHITNFRAFPAYYGLPIKLFLTFKPTSEKKGRYIEGKIHITSYEKRIPKEQLTAFEQAVDEKVEKERKERQSPDSTYTAPAPPETDFSSLMDADEGDDIAGFVQ